MNLPKRIPTTTNRLWHYKFLLSNSTHISLHDHLRAENTKDSRRYRCIILTHQTCYYNVPPQFLALVSSRMIFKPYCNPNSLEIFPNLLPSLHEQPRMCTKITNSPRSFNNRSVYIHIHPD
jgi:hypothetical protein